jgi:hypothetical protein
MSSIPEGLEHRLATARLATAVATVAPGPLQFTPPGSPAAVQDLLLIVKDVHAAAAR